jgi:DNA-binding SARP family transcriptional activator
MGSASVTAQAAGDRLDVGCLVTKVKADVTALRVELLGPVRAWRGEQELELGGPQRRALFSMLAGTRRLMSVGEVIEGLWGQDAPLSATNAVHVHVSQLRGVLEPDRARRSPGRILTAARSGYRLDLTPGSLDTEMLDCHLATARRLAASDQMVALRSLEAALSLWHGPALDGIPGPWADVERTRLDELYQTATGDRLDMLLMLGGHHEVLADLAALSRQHPLRERLRGQFMLALYRCGRQAEALAVYDNARRELAWKLGIDPGPALRRLHARILAADPALDPPRVELDRAWRTSDIGWARSGA